MHYNGELCNGEVETIGNLHDPWLGGLSTTPLSIFFLEKSIVREVASMAENNTYGLEY